MKRIFAVNHVRHIAFHGRSPPICLGVRRERPDSPSEMSRRIDAYDRMNRQLDWACGCLGSGLRSWAIISCGRRWIIAASSPCWPNISSAISTATGRPSPSRRSLSCARRLSFLVLELIRARQRRDERFRPRPHRRSPHHPGPAQPAAEFLRGRVAGLRGLRGHPRLPDADAAEPTNMARAPIAIGSPDAIAPADGAPRSSPVRWTSPGRRSSTRIWRWSGAVSISRRSAPGPQDRSPLRYFVQVRRERRCRQPVRCAPADERRGPSSRFLRPAGAVSRPIWTRVLKRGALPGEIASLYRDAGHDVDRDNYVLFASNEPIPLAACRCWPAEFLIAGILAALVALLFARRRKAVRKMVRARGRSRRHCGSGARSTARSVTACRRRAGGLQAGMAGLKARIEAGPTPTPAEALGTRLRRQRSWTRCLSARRRTARNR